MSKEVKLGPLSNDVRVGPLVVRRISPDGPYPFEVAVGSGAASGYQLEVFRRKSDAIATAERWADLPWAHLVAGVDEVVTGRVGPIVTVSTFELRLRLRRLDAVERELAIAREALAMYDGSAMVIARVRSRRVAADAKAGQ